MKYRASRSFSCRWLGMCLGWLLAHAALTGMAWLDWTVDILGGAAALVGAVLAAVHHAELVAFGFTRRVGAKAADDPLVQAAGLVCRIHRWCGWRADREHPELPEAA